MAACSSDLFDGFTALVFNLLILCGCSSGVVPAFGQDLNYVAVVIEAYDSLKYLILHILKVNTEEHSIMTVSFHILNLLSMFGLTLFLLLTFCL